MTTAAEGLTPVAAQGAFARRLRFADPSMILWLLLIAMLVFLIASPMVRLVVSSFQEPETGRLTLQNYVEAYGRARHLQALWNTLQFGAGVAVLVVHLRRAARLGDLAHRHAGEGLHPADGVRRVHHPALSRRDRLDPARRTERRLAQQGVDGAHRRGRRHLQRLFDDRADRGRGGHVVPLRVRVHQFGARSRLVRNGGRGEYPRRRHHAHDVPRHAAAGAARDRRRADHLVPRSDRAVRRARADRAARALSGRLDAALAVLRISGARRAGGRLRDAAAADHAVHVLAAALGARPARLHHGERQGRRAAHDPARAVALGDARLRAVRLRARGVPADDRADAGGVRQSVGPRLLARQPHAPELPLHPVRADAGAERDHQHLRLFRHHGVRRDRARRSPSPMW